MELTDVFLRHALPAEQGWVMSRNIELNNQTVEYAFRNDYTMTIVLTHMKDPFVSKQHLRQAKELQSACMAKYNLPVAKVLMIYGKLLMNPHDLPKNISVVSVMEEGTGSDTRFSQS